MPMQLTLDFTHKSSAPPGPVHHSTWIEVSDVARGVGFSPVVQISVALRDALEPADTEEEGNYEQRLFDALWMGRFELSLDHRQSANFTFTFPRKHWRTEEITEVSLRLRCEVRDNTVFLGLMEDF